MPGKKGGWGIVYQEVTRNTKLSAEAKGIYAYLCSFAGMGGSCYPSIELMQKELCMSKNRLSKHMQQLIDSGAVERIREKNGNIYGRNIYKITHEAEVIKDLERIAEIVENREVENREVENREVENREVENKAHNNNSLKRNSLNNNSKNNMVNEVDRKQLLQSQKPAEYSKDFEAFWEVYPRTVGKGEAYKKYKARLNDGWSEAELLEAAKNYASKVARERTEQKYIKHPKTFLSENTPFTDFLPKDGNIEQQVSANDADDPYGEWRQ